MSLLGPGIEFETKYKVEDSQLIQFKQLIEKLGTAKFMYVEGGDDYYTYHTDFFKRNQNLDPKGTFIRYRTPSHGLDNGRSEVTWKFKNKKNTNNINRVEHNWRVDNTPSDTIKSALLAQGSYFNFSVFKSCQIYKFDDANIVFYTVYDTTDGDPKKTASFIEIEVCEEKIANMSEEQAWEVIKKYEKALAPLGINAQKRMDKSLFQIYRR